MVELAQLIEIIEFIGLIDLFESTNQLNQPLIRCYAPFINSTIPHSAICLLSLSRFLFISAFSFSTFQPLFLSFRLPHSEFCPLSSALCPPSSALCPLSSALCRRRPVINQ